MLLIRERPRLAHTVIVQTPSGGIYRWAADEPDAANVPSGLRWTSTMPGGFAEMDCTLPRRPDADAGDLERLSTVQILDAGHNIVGEFRLERAPRVSGERMAVTPSAVGWQAHLDDDQSASMVYVDRDLGRWGQESVALRTNTLTLGRKEGSHQVAPDQNTGLPQLRLSVTAPSDANGMSALAMYDAGPGNRIGRIHYSLKNGGNINTADTNWFIALYTAATDSFAGAASTGNVRALLPVSGTFIPPSTARFALIEFTYAAAAAGNLSYELAGENLAVYGDHGLPIIGGPPGGVLASDVVRHAVTTWAPKLRISSAGQSTITPTSFVIPHLVFHEPTTAAEIVKQAARFGLEDWAVWEDRTFWLHPRGQGPSRRWQARVGPAQLEETGPQVDRVWNSVVVAYRDVDGSTRTVGPPGSGADSDDPRLEDQDPENPATKLGIRRRARLQMGVTTAAGAVQVGARFLEQSRLLDRSGRARIVGHVEDEHGHLHPFSAVRAGDTISFVDASDPSPRRIVRAEHDMDQRSCVVELDAPPDALQALLERLGVVLVDLGL